MPIRITSTNYNSQVANVTLYTSTGTTIPYTSANTISLGVQTIPFTYSSPTISNEYGIFSCNFTGFSKTCIINQKTPPDGEGNTYNTIKIGDQIWMSENLKTKRFQNGNLLSNTVEVDNATWSTATTLNKYWANVNGNSSNITIYGLLYNQFAVTGSTVNGVPSNNLCPSGWHVPTSSEFSTLITALGSTPGPKARANAVTLYLNPEINGTNSSGFNAVPSGYRDNSGWFDFRSASYLWTTTTNATPEGLYYTPAFPSFPQSSFALKNGASVRCLKN